MYLQAYASTFAVILGNGLHERARATQCINRATGGRFRVTHVEGQRFLLAFLCCFRNNSDYPYRMRLMFSLERPLSSRPMSSFMVSFPP